MRRCSEAGSGTRWGRAIAKSARDGTAVEGDAVIRQPAPPLAGHNQMVWSLPFAGLSEGHSRPPYWASMTRTPSIACASGLGLECDRWSCPAGQWSLAPTPGRRAQAHCSRNRNRRHSRRVLRAGSRSKRDLNRLEGSRSQRSDSGTEVAAWTRVRQRRERAGSRPHRLASIALCG